VTLTATPASCYLFSSWSGNLTGTTNPATITMNANKSITANFISDPRCTQLGWTSANGITTTTDKVAIGYTGAAFTDNLFVNGTVKILSPGSDGLELGGDNGFINRIRAQSSDNSQLALNANNGISLDGGNVTSIWIKSFNDNTITMQCGILDVNATDASFYNLQANGTITTKEIIVTADGWSDYVFDNNYKLKSLNEVKTFIDKNKHLPGIPDKKEVAAKGVNVGDMQAKLLEKVEELTLYLIEMKKENEILKSRIEKIESVR
jgi:hypothetical protein